ncbi:MAG: 16S rRNA (guanine(966)-N(2))-methyltransferase RsmD [Candidatus Acidiferrales bacterium]
MIAGTFRSRRLKGPGALKIRPTSDRLRETLFNVLGPTVEDSLFFDLYAGTGAIGIEAISRGAREVVFVESHPRTARLIRENLAALGVNGGAEILDVSAQQGLEKLASRHLLADFIFLDPPYNTPDEYTKTLEFLDASHLVAPEGIVIAEHVRKLELPERFPRLERTRLLEQGDVALSFYRLAAAA